MPKRARTPVVGKQMKGAMGESLAAAWLIRQGWQVYQQIGLCLVDLLCYDPESREVLRVEVKTATQKVIGSGEARFYWKVRDDQYEHADMLIITTGDGHVFDATGIDPPVGLEVAGTALMSTAGVRKVGKKKKRAVRDADGNRVYAE